MLQGPVSDFRHFSDSKRHLPGVVAKPRKLSFDTPTGTAMACGGAHRRLSTRSSVGSKESRARIPQMAQIDLCYLRHLSLRFLQQYHFDAAVLIASRLCFIVTDRVFVA